MFTWEEEIEKLKMFSSSSLQDCDISVLDVAICGCGANSIPWLMSDDVLKNVQLHNGLLAG